MRGDFGPFPFFSDQCVVTIPFIKIYFSANFRREPLYLVNIEKLYKLSLFSQH